MHPSADHRPPAGRRAKPSATIVVAEDDTAFRGFLADVLRQDGYEVLEAADAGQLVDYLADSLERSGTHRRPDLVITDLNMPGLSGLDAVAELQYARYSAPFIVMTAFGSEETHARAKRLGALAVLDKPFDIDELRDYVARNLSAA